MQTRSRRQGFRKSTALAALLFATTQSWSALAGATEPIAVAPTDPSTSSVGDVAPEPKGGRPARPPANGLVLGGGVGGSIPGGVAVGQEHLALNLAADDDGAVIIAKGVEPFQLSIGADFGLTPQLSMSAFARYSNARYARVTYADSIVGRLEAETDARHHWVTLGTSFNLTL